MDKNNEEWVEKMLASNADEAQVILADDFETDPVAEKLNRIHRERQLEQEESHLLEEINSQDNPLPLDAIADADDLAESQKSQPVNYKDSDLQDGSESWACEE